ncbi:hypothetical protein AHAS_Ahas18G0225800 [Arachis hypogaea]
MGFTLSLHQRREVRRYQPVRARRSRLWRRGGSSDGEEAPTEQGAAMKKTTCEAASQNTTCREVVGAAPCPAR